MLQQTPPEAITIRLPGPVRGKGRPRFRRAGEFVRTYTDPKTVSYEGALRQAGSDAMNGMPPLEGPVLVVIEAFLAVPASWSRKKREDALWDRIKPTVKPDADNIIKLLDALNEVVFRDDKQIVECRISKFYSDTPQLHIKVEPIDSRPTEAAA